MEGIYVCIIECSSAPITAPLISKEYDWIKGFPNENKFQYCDFITFHISYRAGFPYFHIEMSCVSRYCNSIIKYKNVCISSYYLIVKKITYKMMLNGRKETKGFLVTNLKIILANFIIYILVLCKWSHSQPRNLVRLRKSLNSALGKHWPHWDVNCLGSQRTKT